ncbi:MAG: hypothetical protein WCP01_17295 [Methylococcaceae bacterium]
MATPTYLNSTEQNLQFFSLAQKKSIRHELLAWKISDNDQPSPILFPTPELGSTIVYQMGSTERVVDLHTGVAYLNMNVAIESQS